MKGTPPSYAELLRELEAERYAPPPEPIDDKTAAARRRAQLEADTLAYEQAQARRRLRAAS